MNLSELSKKIPRTALYGAAALALGFAGGRLLTRPKIVTVDHETVHEVIKEDTHAREQVRELTEQLETLKRDTHRVSITTKTVDGTLTRRVETDTHVDRSTDTRGDTSSQKASDTTKQTETVREVIRTVTISPPAKHWHAGPMVLLRPSAAALADPLGSLSAGALVGYSLGPLSLDLSATVPVRQPFTFPVFGLSLTLAF